MNNFRFNCLKNANNETMLAVICCGEYNLASPTHVTVSDNNVAFVESISAEDTSAFIGPLTAGTYRISIAGEGDINAVGQFTLSTQDDLLLSDEILALTESDVAPASARATAYMFYAYSSAGLLCGTFESLFSAIEQTRQLGSGAYVLLNGTGSEVFRYGVSGRYYKFQFTASYGYVSSTSAADAWLTGYSCSYAIDSSTARMYGCHHVDLGTGKSPEWAYEPNSGGYYYQYSALNNGLIKASMTVSLAGAKFHPSENAVQKFNPYVFINVHNGAAGCDFCLKADQDAAGTTLPWKTYYYYTDATGYVAELGDTVCTATKDANGDWVANANVRITVEMTSEGMCGTFENLSTGVVRQVNVKKDNLTVSSEKLVFNLAVSCVPNLSRTDRNTPDYRSGAYFKNVTIQNCKAYNASGTAYNFYVNSNVTDMALRYNTDCCEVTTTSTSTTVNIAYDKAYRT